MARIRHSAEQIINKLREAEVPRELGVPDGVRPSDRPLGIPSLTRGALNFRTDLFLIHTRHVWPEPALGSCREQHPTQSQYSTHRQ